jgi:hypothetical protein
MNHLRRFRSAILSICSLLTCLIGTLSVPISAGAEDSCEGPRIKLVVRTIHASGARAGSPQANSAETGVSVENSLSDIKPKLEMLPFSTFHLISQKEEEISVKKKESIQLPNGQTLSFRPMYMDKERVGMWLSWKDTDGSDILNTRIHFDADESVLTGTDYRENEGRILAIRATKLD